ncbi:inactive rhomboid protein 1-like isoform X1 [Centruroides vittatus]|uniref:inactive rhomboid protein 1-like isoform X1 n=2 Tax=Centruroides vittatus TaxID=120091 RepID=UPI00351081D3
MDKDKPSIGKEENVIDYDFPSTRKSTLKNFPQIIKRFFGIYDEVDLLLWKELFLKRIEVGLVGLNIRYAFTCSRYIFPPHDIIESRMRMPSEAERRRGPQFPGINKLRSFFGKKEESESSDALYGFAYGSQAYKFYRKLIAAEMEVNKSERGGSRFSIPKPSIIKFSLGGKDMPEDISPDVQEQLDVAAAQRRKPLAVTFPYFITSMTMLQFLIMIIISSSGGIAPVGLHPVVEFLLDVDTFSGHQPIDYWHTPNMWIGPSKRSLIKHGAVYTPCMRKDASIIHDLMKQGFSVSDPLGCCYNDLRKIAATTTENECKYLSDDGATWDVTRCTSVIYSRMKHVLKPCCYGLLGKCFLTNEIECQFLHGRWHPHKDHCMEVNCFASFCGSFGITYPKQGISFIPTGIRQSWRFVLPVFYHAGFIHYFLVSILQWIIGRPLEEMIGCVRIGLIYILSSFGGNLAAGFFDPQTPHVGACGAISGILALHLLEIVEGFRIIKSISREITSIVLILVLLLIAGTFPLVDNFAHVGGFLYGLLLGILTMPHICFGRNTLVRRKQLVIASSVVLILITFFMFIAFYVIHDTNFCSSCHKFSCIAYTSTMCNHTFDLDSTTYKP